MGRLVLLDSDGERVEVEEGESCDVVATFYDTDGSALAKASIATLTATLQDATTNAAINSRDGQDVLDANGGTVTTAGVLTLKLQPADNTNVGSSKGEVESHYLLLQWTWVDGAAVTRTGRQEYEIFVRVITDAT